MVDDYRTRTRSNSFADRERTELERRQALAEAAEREREDRLARVLDRSRREQAAAASRREAFFAERQRAHDAAQARVEAEQAGAREAELRRRFAERYPGAPESDFKLLRGELLAEIGTEHAEATAQLRGRRYSI